MVVTVFYPTERNVDLRIDCWIITDRLLLQKVRTRSHRSLPLIRILAFGGNLKTFKFSLNISIECSESNNKNKCKTKTIAVFESTAICVGAGKATSRLWFIEMGTSKI